MAHPRASHGSDSPTTLTSPAYDSEEKKSNTLFQDEHPAKTASHNRKGSHDPNWDGHDVDFSHVDEKKVLRKMDIRLLPMLALLYLLSFLEVCHPYTWVTPIE